jgi:hypothetical protein
MSGNHQVPLWVDSRYMQLLDATVRSYLQYSYSVPLSVILDTAGRYLSVKRDMHLRITNILPEA